MRVIDLFEAPISHYEVHGMDEPGSFPDVDRRNLQAAAHITKIKKHFEKTDYDFNLYFINLKEKNFIDSGDDWPEPAFTFEWEEMLKNDAGYTDTQRVLELTGITIKPDPVAISVIFVSNANVDNTVSMTPWIIAHRFAHALTDAKSRLPQQIQRLFDLIPASGNSEIASAGGNPRQLGGYHVSLRQILSMRSARTGTLNKGEDIEELIAQYLIQGKIGIQPLRYPADVVAATQAALMAQINQKVRQIEGYLDAILENCVGGMFLAV